MPQHLSWFDRMHFLHRAWRYRLRSERAELSFMRRCDLAGKTAVDIGAHRGIYSYWMHRAVGPGGRVVAFEPQPEMQECLESARATFGLEQLSIRRCALSATAGSMRLVRDPSHTGGARLNGSAPPADDALECFDVPVATLDDHFDGDGGPPVGFIKCDVEGHETAVFEGGRRVLERERPVLLVEVHDRHVREGSLLRLLDGLGYDAFLLHPGGIAPIAEYARLRPGIDKAYLNYAFQPRGGGSAR